MPKQPSLAMSDDIDHVLFAEGQIQARVAQLGAQMTRDYAGSCPVVVGVLRGGFVFMADLVRHVDLPCQIDFVAVSSYGDATTSSGAVRITKDLSLDIAGRDVIVVEDMLDSGATLKCLCELLGKRGPRSLQIAVLLLKNPRPAVTPRYVGFECPEEFVVGYGLDFAQNYRGLPYIGVLKPEMYLD